MDSFSSSFLVSWMEVNNRQARFLPRYSCVHNDCLPLCLPPFSFRKEDFLAGASSQVESLQVDSLLLQSKSSSHSGSHRPGKKTFRLACACLQCTGDSAAHASRAGKRIWPQFSTRLFPCRTTFLSTRYRCNTTAWGGAAAVLQDSIAVVCVACKKRFFQSLAWPIHFYVNMTRLALSLPAPAPPLETLLKKVD